MAAVITSPINALTDDISLLKPVGEPRIHEQNFYSPLEVWISKYPEETSWILTIISGI
jgi:hypothetical protein